MGKTKYEIKIEIFKGENCDHHKLGETFKYPEDVGAICPWLLDSINGMVRVLQFGGQLPWTYQGTEYEKEIENEGVTTEYVRCPDPTDVGIVAKITRVELKVPKDVGWT